MNTKRLVPIALVALLGWAVPVVAAEDGKALYESRCAMCHGMDGVAKKMATGSKNFDDPAWKRAATVASIVNATKDGVGKMKGLGEKLNAEQMKAVADYVLTLAK